MHRDEDMVCYLSWLIHSFIYSFILLFLYHSSFIYSRIRLFIR